MIVNYSDQEVNLNSPSIFLAGPTPRSESVNSWRPEALDILNELGFKGVVYVPEQKDRVKFDYNDQVWWERNALTASTVIVFWIPRQLPDMPAFTTNVEFGYHVKSGKTVYGRPDNSEKNRYLDWLYTVETNNQPHNDLRELLKQAVQLCNKKTDL